MSLAHGPVMAFSGAGVPPQQHVMTVTVHVHYAPSHHQSQLHPDEQQPTSPQGNSMLCYAQGCFTAVSPTLIAASLSQSAPLGKLAAATPRILTAVLLDPADPPPRLQA